MASVSIRIGSRHLAVNGDILQSLCPDLYRDIWAGNGNDLVRQVCNTLNGLTNPSITEHAVEGVLTKVFQSMQTTSWPFGHSNPERRIRRLVQDLLPNDIHHHGIHGLRHSRHTFLIICAFAKLALSQPLADQMMKVFQNKQFDIQEWEISAHHLNEWQLGLRALSELSLEQDTFGNNLFNTWPPTPSLLPLMLAPHHNPYDTYRHRGRSPLLLTAPHYPRARSLGHRRNHGLQLALPRSSNSAWNSPVLSPALRPGSYFDDVGQLQWQQEEMNWKLDGIDRKLDHLVGW